LAASCGLDIFFLSSAITLQVATARP
jgi:hypothetical protein